MAHLYTPKSGPVRYSQPQSHSRPQPQRKPQRVPGESRYRTEDDPDYWEYFAWKQRRKLPGSDIVIPLRHQSNRLALGAAPVKKQKIPIRRTIRMEVREWQKGVSNGPGYTVKEAQTIVQDESLQAKDKESRSALSQKHICEERKSSKSEEDSDWTDVGYTTDEDGYDMV